MASSNTTNQQSGLFGLKYANRDFTQKEAWGKNCFNSSLPASLCSYLSFRNLDNIYIKLDASLSVEHSQISTADLFGINPQSDNLFYAFETQFTPYQKYLIGTLPGVDLVTQSRNNGNCLRPIEIKLTALPDNTTCKLAEDFYGCEIVVRPDTIVYLACSIVETFGQKMSGIKNLTNKDFAKITDWTEPDCVIPHIPQIIHAIDAIALAILEHQKPFLMQPVWKTQGKSSTLAEHWGIHLSRKIEAR
ncbi:MAG: HindVP family restriction endonuclease [Leptolyngbyaceae cyanobacterium]